MAKAAHEGVYLVSSEGSGFFYTFRRNKKKGKGESKLALKKYDPVARKHVLFNEKKLSKLKKKYNPQAAASAAPAKSDKTAAAAE